MITRRLHNVQARDDELIYAKAARHARACPLLCFQVSFVPSESRDAPACRFIMKIAHIVPGMSPNFGGPSVALIGMTRALRQRGIDAEILTTNADPTGRVDVPLGRPVDQNGTKVTYYNLWIKGKYALSLDLAQALSRKVREYDVLHVHWLYNFSPLLAAILARRSAVPYVLQPNGSLDPYLMKKNHLIKRFYLLSLGGIVLNQAAAILFTTEAERRLASGINFRAPSFVVPVGLDWAEYEQLPKQGEFRERFPETREKRIVLFLGRVSRQKGLDLLIKAFREVVTVNDNVHLMIVGPEEEGYGARVRRWVSEESLEQNVTFVGPLHGRQKLAAYVDSAVFVLPSYAENFGATVTEALACKRPVVISDRVNICDEIASAEAGIVVECTAASVAEGITRVLQERDVAERLGENGYELAKRKFTWDVALDTLIPIYQGLVGKGRGEMNIVGEKGE